MSPAQPPYLVAPMKELSAEARQWQHRGNPEGRVKVGLVLRLWKALERAGRHEEVVR